MEQIEVPKQNEKVQNYALITLEKKILCPLGSALIGSKLDMDVASKSCRLAFSGRLLSAVDSGEELKQVRVFKEKEKEGFVDRIADGLAYFNPLQP